MSEEGDKLQLTDAGRKFIDDWPLRVLQWLFKENASNHTLLEELCDEHKGTFQGRAAIVEKVNEPLSCELLFLEEPVSHPIPWWSCKPLHG